MDIREVTFMDIVWIHLNQGRDWWRVLMNTVINFWVL
jgi:hypothetical protein